MKDTRHTQKLNQYYIYNKIQNQNQHTNMRFIPSHKHKHNYPLAETLFFSFALFLVVGIFFEVSFHFLQFGRNSISVDRPEWEHVHYHGDISITRKEIPEKNLYLYRYEYDTDVPMKGLMSILDHGSKTNDWVAWSIKDHQENKQGEEASDNLVRMRLKLPYLRLHNREVIAQLSKEGEEEKKRSPMSAVLHHAIPIDVTHEIKKDMDIATYHIKSHNLLRSDEINNDYYKIVKCEDCKQAELDCTITLTQSNEQDGTRLIMEMYFDPKSSKLPSFLVNDIVKRWGSTSLHKLVNQCYENLDTKNHNKVNWKVELQSIFPLKH